MSLKVGTKTIEKIGYKVNPQTVKEIDAVIHDARLIFNNEQAYASDKRLLIQWAYYSSITLTYWVEDATTGEKIAGLPLKIFRMDNDFPLIGEYTSPTSSGTITVKSNKNYNIICLGNSTYPAVEAVGLFNER